MKKKEKRKILPIVFHIEGYVFTLYSYRLSRWAILGLSICAQGALAFYIFDIQIGKWGLMFRAMDERRM